MPQMKPLHWTFLSLLLMTMFYTYFSHTYFFYQFKIPNKKMKTNKKSFIYNW